VKGTNESPYLEFYVSKEYLINVPFNDANLSISVCVTHEYGTKFRSIKFRSFRLISFLLWLQ